MSVFVIFMNRAHRLADQVRNVVGWFGRVPTESQFLSKGLLTPGEFVDAGDQLVFQCPTWQWQGCCGKKRQVFWLPPNKQYLLTRNIPCRHRVAEWDDSFCKRAQVTPEGWLIPGPQPSTTTTGDTSSRNAVHNLSDDQCMVDGKIVAVRHGVESSSGDEGGAAPPDEDGEFTIVVDDEGGSLTTPPPRTTKEKKAHGFIVPTRSYDLSITYDKYYQSPRLWLFGYDENGVPLTADAVFQDIHSDYLSKTVTVDPHPFSGVPTVSVHPCKHASVMRSVAQSWLRSGIEPRHDLALFVLLKMVASVVPTINYDFTIDVIMPLGENAVAIEEEEQETDTAL